MSKGGAKGYWCCCRNCWHLHTHRPCCASAPFSALRNDVVVGGGGNTGNGGGTGIPRSCKACGCTPLVGQRSARCPRICASAAYEGGGLVVGAAIVGSGGCTRQAGGERCAYVATAALGILGYAVEGGRGGGQRPR